MCEANAYIETEGTEELFMESVDMIQPETENRLLIVNIFGDQKIVRGKIKKNLVTQSQDYPGENRITVKIPEKIEHFMDGFTVPKNRYPSAEEEDRSIKAMKAYFPVRKLETFMAFFVSR